MAKKKRYTTKDKIPRIPANTPRPRVWDQLNELKENSRNLMLQAGQIKPFLQDKTLQNHLENPQETARLVYSVANDSKEFIKQFHDISKQHEDKSGIAKNETEFNESLNLSLQYFELTEGFKSTVLTNVADICDHYIKAANTRESIVNPKTEPQEQAQ